ncbi:MAG TPA: MauE/DoxX family redox-associated membrane protein [Bryobacteraceae bacterium]|nr:MauE/DoxX family redox-associated membrane protein [Bryobacteraceae bacterium]
MTSPSKGFRVAALLLRLALGIIFLYAAWTKISRPWELFAMAIDSYGLLPLKWVELVARTLPWIEVAIGVFLIAGIFLRSAAVATTLLLAVFFSLMVRAYAKGMQINCGCFGAGEVISWKTLLRDGSMLAAAVALASMSFVRRRKAIQ